MYDYFGYFCNRSLEKKLQNRIFIVLSFYCKLSLHIFEKPSSLNECQMPIIKC